AASEGMVNEDPILAAQKAKREAEGRLEGQKLRHHSEREAMLDAAAADIKANAGAYSGRAYNTYFGSGLADWMGAEDQWLRARVSEDDFARRNGGQHVFSDSVRADVVSYLERQANAAERTAEATERMER